MRKRRAGLKTVPDYIRQELDASLLQLLTEDGHGLSFPDTHFCQVRIVRNKQDYGRVFHYNDFESTGQTIAAAVSFTLQQRKMLSDSNIFSVRGPYGGVRLAASYRPKRDETEYCHVVSYVRVDGSVTNKTFYHGITPPTPGQWLHGQHTALLFRMEQLILRDCGQDIDVGQYNNWRRVRLYANSQPVEYKNL